MSFLSKRLTIELGKIEGFERSMNSDRRVSRGFDKINFSSQNISFNREENFKEKDVSLDFNGNLNLLLNKSEKKHLGSQFKNNCSILTLTNNPNNQTNKTQFNIRQYTNDLNDKTNNMITGLNILVTNEDGIITPDQSAGLLMNPIQNQINPSHYSIRCGDRTQDFSCEVEKNQQTTGPCKIIQRFNINPYQNLDLVKKYFIYQLKKSFLQAKKYVINNVVHSELRNQNKKNLNYHEIFSNYSQITNSNVNSYVKYEDRSVEINNYFIYKNILLGKGGYSTVYKCRNLKDNKEYVIYI